MTKRDIPWAIEPSVERDRAVRIADALYDVLTESRVKSKDRYGLAEELTRAAIVALDSASTEAVVAQPFDPHGYFVYVLWSSNPRRAVYVGRSANILARLGAHWRNKEKRAVMDRVEIIRCRDSWEMEQMEVRLIRKYRPPLNITRYGCDWSAAG